MSSLEEHRWDLEALSRELKIPEQDLKAYLDHPESTRAMAVLWRMADRVIQHKVLDLRMKALHKLELAMEADDQRVQVSACKILLDFADAMQERISVEELNEKLKSLQAR